MVLEGFNLEFIVCAILQVADLDCLTVLANLQVFNGVIGYGIFQLLMVLALGFGILGKAHAQRAYGH